MLESKLNNNPFFEETILEENISGDILEIVDEELIADLEIQNIFFDNKEADAKVDFLRLINTENGSNKFWEIKANKNELIIQYGKVGTKGQRLVKEFDSEEIAEKEMKNLVKQKRGRGYV